MLLKNIVNSDRWWQYMDPLPFYDQAQPMVASLLQHVFIQNISKSIDSIRLYTLLLSVFIASPFLYVLYKERAGFSLPSLVFLAFSFSLGFYLTEIKHYSFEIAASFFMISIFYLNMKGEMRFELATVSIGAAICFGFSTLIPAFVLISYLTALQINEYGRDFFSGRNLASLFLVFVIALISFLHMDQLTVYQINNFAAYHSKGLLGDIKTLIFAGVSAHGKFLTIAVAIIVVASLFRDKRSLFFHINLVFVLIVGFICLGKLIGVYPIASSRHIIWLAPFSFLILVIGILDFVKSERFLVAALGWGALVLVLFQAGDVIYQTYNGRSPELTENARLYQELATLEPSQVAVYPHAQPTLDFYLETNEQLRKHSYTGLTEYLSGPKKATTGKSRFRDRVDKSLIPLLNGVSHYVISHLDLFAPPERAVNFMSSRRSYLKAKFLEYGCSYKAIFSGHRASLLKVSCLKECLRCQN